MNLNFTHSNSLFEQNSTWYDSQQHPFMMANTNTNTNITTNANIASSNVVGYKGVACCECGSHFFQIEHYVAHLESTGHKKRSPSSCNDVQDSPPSILSSSSAPFMPSDSYLLSPPPGLTLGGKPVVFKPVQTPPHTPLRVYAPKTKHQKSKFTLFFGAAVKSDSLVGGCGWWIRDSSNTVVTHGSVPVQQPYSSLPRLEYEALLNGLIAAHVKKIRCLCVKSHCELSFLMMQGREVPGLSSVMYSLRDLNTAIAKLLPQFQSLEVELISVEQNHYSQKLAKTVIDDFLRRQEKMAHDKMVQLQSAPAPVPEKVSKPIAPVMEKKQPVQPIVRPTWPVVSPPAPFVLHLPRESRFNSFDETARMATCSSSYDTSSSMTASNTSVSVPVNYFDGWESSSFLDGLSFGSGTTSRDSASAITTPQRPLAQMPAPEGNLLLAACERVAGPFDLGLDLSFPSQPSSNRSAASLDSLLSDGSGLASRSLLAPFPDVSAIMWENMLKSMHYEVLQDEN